jgi:hypothetical protein
VKKSYSKAATQQNKTIQIKAIINQNNIYLAPILGKLNPLNHFLKFHNISILNIMFIYLYYKKQPADAGCLLLIQI